MAVTINYNNNTVTIDGVSYGILDIPDDIWVEMDWDYRIPIMFMQMDHYLEQERLEEERRAALRKQEWMIRFAGMMTAKLKQQKKDEDKEDKAGKGKGKAGPSGIWSCYSCFQVFYYEFYLSIYKYICLWVFL